MFEHPDWDFDPGLCDKTGFWYPKSWNDKLGKWPSVCGLQVEDAEHYLKMFNLGLLNIDS